jgi:hypothetical protein
MKRVVIAVLVGAIILFAWQAISHMMLGDVLHNSMSKEAPNAQAILDALNGAEDGAYCAPGKMEGESDQDMMKRLDGKPGAMIFYDAAMDMNMTRPMIVGFILDLLGLWIVVCAMGYARERLITFGKRWCFVILFAMIISVFD